MNRTESPMNHLRLESKCGADNCQQYGGRHQCGRPSTLQICRRNFRRWRQVVCLGLTQNDEERMNATDARFLRIIDTRVLIAAFLQFLHPLLTALAQGFEVAKLDGLCRARFRACRSQSGFLAVVTERAFERTTVGWPLVDHAERT